MSGSSVNSAPIGSGRSANMPAAVAPSVRSTVGNTPSRAPRKPHTSLPAAPPAKTSVKATPISGRPAPFERNRNGRKVRKPIRVAAVDQADYQQKREAVAQQLGPGFGLFGPDRW